MTRFAFLAFASLLFILVPHLLVAQESAAVSIASDDLLAPKDSAASLNPLYFNQWIRITSEGSIRGSVVPASGATGVNLFGTRVSLISNGSVVFQAITDPRGNFVIGNATPGTYSLVAVGENQLAVCALTVLSSSKGQHLPDRVRVPSLSPSSPRVAELIRGNTMPTWTAGVSMDTDPIASVRVSSDSTTVRIDPQGGISGTVRRPNVMVDLSSTLVYLIRDGREIARTRATGSGAFRFDGVEPGGYGLVVSGSEGIAALGFTASDGKIAALGQHSGKLVSLVSQEEVQAGLRTLSDSLNVELAEPASFGAESVLLEELADAEMVAPFPTMLGSYGSLPGGGGFGGGAGGGVGGWGSLAALGALSAVAIATGTDDKAPIIVVSPIK